MSIWHRRAGKDKTFVNLVAKEMVKRVGAYYYFFPTYKQGRKILWDGMDRDGFPFMGHFPKELVAENNRTEMKKVLRNRSIFQIVGSDNIDSIVGTNPIGCVFSEFSLQNPAGWDYIRPILRENGGWALFNYTPRGHNHGKSLYEMALDNDDWFVELLTVDNTRRPDGTPVVTKEMIDADLREGMSEDLILQEYYCSFEAANPGAYYSSELKKAREQGRITVVPHEPGIPVDTWWDLGMDDSMTIWFSQDCGREVHFIDYYENSGEGIQFYIDRLEEKAALRGFRYGRHVAPHDIKVREIGPGISRWESAKKKGLIFDIAYRVERKEDGIEAVRRIFPICFFDKEHCQRGIEALSDFQKEIDEKNSMGYGKRMYKPTPLRNWAIHGADAFQTFAISHKLARRFEQLGGAFG